jgi:hypothetical protein
MNLFQILALPFCLLLAFRVAVRTLQRRISRRQGVVWTLLWLCGAALIAEPGISVALAASLGIGRGSDFVFYVAVLAGMAVALYFYNRYRTMEILITELIRRDAMQRPERGCEHLGSAADRAAIGPESTPGRAGAQQSDSGPDATAQH